LKSEKCLERGTSIISFLQEKNEKEPVNMLRKKNEKEPECVDEEERKGT
jgi:hypothetical protein